MSETSVSFLNSLRADSDSRSWQEFVDLYTPLIRIWLSNQHVHEQECEDVTQEVMSVVLKRLPEFQRQRTGSFRNWLKTITIYCWQNYRRKHLQRLAAVGGTSFGETMNELADPGSHLSSLWDQQHDQYVLQRLLEKIRPSIRESTWAAFEAVAIDGKSPEEAAEALGMSTNAVYVAKSRVLAQLRQVGEGLVSWD
jgi:RNA polymerase sigma-70 factor (ECF subfamily)